MVLAAGPKRCSRAMGDPDTHAIQICQANM